MRRRLACAVALTVVAGSLAPAWAAAKNADGTQGARYDAPLSKATRAKVVEALARDLAADYAVESMGQRMASVIRAKLRNGAYEHVASPTELAAALQDDVRGVNRDLHLQIMFDPAWRPPEQGPPPDWRRLAGGVLSVQVLDGNIGYLKLGGFPPAEASRDFIAAAFVILHNTDALIVDVRENHGGDPASVALLMSYLVDGPPIVVNTLQYRKDDQRQDLRTTPMGNASFGAHKPVFVLVSKRTFSGGEALAYDVQALRRGVVIGETTPGGANPTAPSALGYGFVAFIPYARALSPITGANWDGVGVRPDIAVSTDEALTTAMRLASSKASVADPR